MAKYWCDFSASVLVEADSIDEAREQFYSGNYLNDNLDYIELDNVEKAEEI